MKKESLREYLEKQINHFNKRYKSSDNIIDKLKSDLFKQVLGYLEREGWRNTYEWVKNQYKKFDGSLRKGPANMAAAYKQVRDKIWSLERKHGDAHAKKNP